MAEELLAIKNLTKIYHPHTSGEVKALDDLSFTIYKGDFVTIVGSNAAGKSTLFNCIAGSLLPSHGAIYLEGNSIINIPEYKRARYISRVRQNPNESIVPSLTLAENLALAQLRCSRVTLHRGVKSEWKAEFTDLLRPFGIGLEKRLNDTIDLLSGGQKQTVALLMATMTHPKLLLLDEHTAALDPKMSRKILHISQDIVEKSKVTTLMITHNMHQALEYGNRLVVLSEGKAVFDASGDQKKKLTIEEIVNKIEGVNASK